MKEIKDKEYRYQIVNTSVNESKKGIRFHYPFFADIYNYQEFNFSTAQEYIMREGLDMFSSINTGMDMAGALNKLVSSHFKFAAEYLSEVSPYDYNVAPSKRPRMYLSWQVFVSKDIKDKTFYFTSAGQIDRGQMAVSNLSKSGPNGSYKFEV